MCGCGKSAAQGNAQVASASAVTYEVVLPDGSKRSATSQLEAKVIIARAGGGSWSQAAA